MLISNKELKNTQAFGFNPQSIFHGYLKATVSLKVEVMSNHVQLILEHCE